ncbi:hypothetical protein [Marinoscillum pacificum]|uniref:hypothetical protein n=1 Tax=Marinoscillum pacificum TaxID=392723 RepID=UPI0021582815|nr:hypothetical protein [Marinoscillum pacificum]
MSHSPLLDSIIVFISSDDEKTRSLLNVIRRQDVSRSVHWLRNHDQVKRHFQNPKQFLDFKESGQEVAIILDYDLEGVSLVTRHLEEQGVLKVCTLFSLKSVADEVGELNKMLRTV